MSLTQSCETGSHSIRRKIGYQDALRCEVRHRRLVSSDLLVFGELRKYGRVELTAKLHQVEQRRRAAGSGRRAPALAVGRNSVCWRYGDAAVERVHSMTISLLNVLMALSYLHLKHYFCDFAFQTAYQVKHKSIYGHVGGLSHAATHTLGTLPLFLFLTPPLEIGVSLAAAEFLLHYHIDWTKELILRRAGWKPGSYGFWQALGIDQFLHYLSYTGIVTVLATSS